MSEKYPRTFHLPWSPGGTKDDRRLGDVRSFLNRELVITEKLDGSNVCLERKQMFARSHNDAPRHESFDALKALHAAMHWSIPESWQIFGEWLWARHSITYDRLPAFLLVFGIRDQATETWLAWGACVTACEERGLLTVPVLWRGSVQTEAELQQLTEDLLDRHTCGLEQEGIVVRAASGFADAKFGALVAKWVRANHVQTDDHWSSQQIVRNRLDVGTSK